jgi:hypothetical protein
MLLEQEIKAAQEAQQLAEKHNKDSKIAENLHIAKAKQENIASSQHVQV